jgi:hypothetical protein
VGDGAKQQAKVLADEAGEQGGQVGDAADDHLDLGLGTWRRAGAGRGSAWGRGTGVDVLR